MILLWRRGRWSDAALRAADVVVTMGCGEACPIYPGKRYTDWEVADPAGRPIDEVRVIRDEIERRVRRLLAELGVATLLFSDPEISDAPDAVELEEFRDAIRFNNVSYETTYEFH